MENIKDYDIYINRMNLSIQDKAFWVSSLPTSIQYVIDFGCADGALIQYVKDNYPGRFKAFYGIDNDREMQLKVRQRFQKDNDVCILPELDYELIKNFPESVFIMNSVIHEIASYNGYEAFIDILQFLNKNKIGAIAIRDMYFSNFLCSKEYTDSCIEINNFEFNFMNSNKFSEYFSRYLELKILNKNKMSRLELFQEFLMKYNYSENWERERKEKYLWPWNYTILNFISNYEYEIVINEKFSIPQQKEKIYNDLGVMWPLPTHAKFLIIRKDLV